MATIGITTTRTTEMVAPVGIVVEATDHAGFERNGPAKAEVFDPTWQEFFYIWKAKKSDEAGGWLDDQIQLKDEAGVLNIPDAWRNLNVMYAPRAAFVFRDPGTWKVTLWCVELSSGISAEAETQEFVVGDPNLVYQGARTGVFSSAGDFTGAPQGAVLCTTLSQVSDLINSQSQTGRVLFRRGETTDIGAVGGGIFTQNYGSWKNVRLGAFGRGARPAFTGGTLIWIERNTNGAVGDFVFQDIRMVGGWDAAREAGKSLELHQWKHWDYINEPFVLYDNIEMDGAGLYPLSGGAVPEGQCIIYDSYVHNWGGANVRYGIFVGGGIGCAAVGLAAHQNPDACIGSMTEPFLNYGAAFRDPGDARSDSVNRKTTIAASSFYSNSGWSGWAWGGIAAAQPALRINTSGRLGTRYALDRVAAEGGFKVIDGIESSGAFGASMNIVADKLLLVTSATFHDSVVTWQFGGTWRNVLVVSPDCDTPRKTPKAALTAYLPVNRSVDFAESPLSLYNWTVANLSADYGITPFVIDHGVVTVTQVNNIEEDAAGGQTTGGLLDLATGIAGFLPLSKGIRFSVTKPVLSNGSLAPGSSVDVPWPVQNYIDPATDLVAARQLSNTDFAAADIHAVSCNEGVFQAVDGQLALDVSDPAKAVLTNTSGAAWTGDLVVNLVPKPDSVAAVTDTAFATPVPVPAVLPVSAAQALQAQATPVAWDSLFAPGARRSAPATSGAAEN